MSATPARAVAAVLLAALLAALPPGCSDDEPAGPGDASGTGPASPFAPGIAPNPYLGAPGTAAMHGDSGSSDTTPLEGPGTGALDVAAVDVGAVCSVVAVGGDGFPVALCTRVSDAVPVVLLLDPDTGSPLASLDMVPGALLGGVYGYLDDEDRMVLADGNGDLLRIAHTPTDSGWALEVDQSVPLGGSIPPGEAVTSVSPGYDGGVWFATDGATVGVVGPGDATVRTVGLGDGEQVANSISTAPQGMAVASTHALYLVGRDDDGGPRVLWRHEYDRGSARNPGQLSWGTGSTPTFFGPDTGSDYVAIVDNADERVHLEVLRVDGPDAGTPVCSTAVLAEGGPGSENSPIGAGRSVFVAGTYGYPYPRYPEGAGPSEPASADFAGGMTRVEVREDDTGCDVVWESDVRSAAVPKLSTPSGTITTFTRRDPAGAGPSFAYAVIDAADGDVLAEQDLGDPAADPLQLAGTTAPGGVLYQGTLGTILRLSARPGDDPTQ